MVPLRAVEGAPNEGLWKLQLHDKTMHSLLEARNRGSVLSDTQKVTSPQAPNKQTLKMNRSCHPCQISIFLFPDSAVTLQHRYSDLTGHKSVIQRVFCAEAGAGIHMPGQVLGEPLIPVTCHD